MLSVFEVEKVQYTLTCRGRARAMERGEGECEDEAVVGSDPPVRRSSPGFPR